MIYLSVTECNAQADIVFLLDSSGSVGSSNFQKMLGFVKNVANSFDIGPTDVQIGVDTFQTSHKAEFNLNTYSDKQRMLTAINNIKYTTGLTHTGDAIRFMRTDSFSAAKGKDCIWKNRSSTFLKVEIAKTVVLYIYIYISFLSFFFYKR